MEQKIGDNYVLDQIHFQYTFLGFFRFIGKPPITRTYCTANGPPLPPISILNQHSSMLATAEADAIFGMK